MSKIVPGFWYHHNKDNRKFKICKTNGYYFEKFTEKLKIVEEAYPKFLKMISNQLNKAHRLNWQDNVWEIIIGTWIKKYLIVIADRISITENNIVEGNEFFFQKRKELRTNLNSRDISEFINNVFNDGWNEEIFIRLHNYKVTNNIDSLIFKEKIKIKYKKRSFLKKLKIRLYNLITNVYVKLFCSKSRIIFSRPYFGSKIKFLSFLLSLKEFPIIYHLDDDPVNAQYNSELRNKMNLNLDQNEFYKIASFLFNECFPRIYLEGFPKILNKIKKTSLPNDKKIIFTCNIHNDSIFKFWTAIQKNIGAKLIIAQHGGGYNLFSYDEKRDYQLSICDKFLTTGWSYKKYEKKIEKFSIITNQVYKDKSIYGDKIYLILNNFDNYIYSADYVTSIDLINSEKNKNYTELHEVSKFLEKLNPEIRKKIILRPHPSHERRHTTRHFEEVFKDKITINSNFKIPIMNLLKEARINIIPQPYGTTFTYSMSNNYPTVTLFPHDLSHLNYETKNIFESLFSAGICHKNNESLKIFIEKNFHNFSNWWESTKTQNARNLFCEAQGRVLPNRLELLRDILLNEKKEIA